MLITRRSRRPHAIVLSAGQGRRLLPLTADTPKCLLPIEGERTVLELQLEALAACDVTNVTVMLGFGREQVEAHLARRRPHRVSVRTRYNPFYAVSDNLVTCWLASSDMRDDFVLLNGDTLFDAAILERALARSTGPVTITVDRKPTYDEDDMKVVTGRDGRLLTVGKTIPPAEAHGEAIGLSVFRGVGCHAFRRALERAIHDPGAVRRWYLDVIATLAQTLPVTCASIEGLWWCEIDTAADLAAARDALRQRTIEDRPAIGAVARG
jgi:choline kinase